MPIFEYKCRDCNFKFQKLVKNSDITVVCPNCQKTNIEKMVSAFSSSLSSCSDCCSNCSDCYPDI